MATRLKKPKKVIIRKPRVVKPKPVRVPRPPRVAKIYETYLFPAPKLAQLKPGDTVYEVPPPKISPPLPRAWWVVPASGATKKLPKGAKVAADIY